MCMAFQLRIYGTIPYTTVSYMYITSKYDFVKKSEHTRQNTGAIGLSCTFFARDRMKEVAMG